MALFRSTAELDQQRMNTAAFGTQLKSFGKKALATAAGLKVQNGRITGEKSLFGKVRSITPGGNVVSQLGQRAVASKNSDAGKVIRDRTDDEMATTIAGLKLMGDAISLGGGSAAGGAAATGASGGAAMGSIGTGATGGATFGQSIAGVGSGGGMMSTAGGTSAMGGAGSSAIPSLATQPISPAKDFATKQLTTGSDQDLMSSVLDGTTKIDESANDMEEETVDEADYTNAPEGEGNELDMLSEATDAIPVVGSAINLFKTADQTNKNTKASIMRRTKENQPGLPTRRAS